jgi:hypothetical protein
MDASEAWTTTLPTESHGHPTPPQDVAGHGLPKHQHIPTRLPGATHQDRLREDAQPHNHTKPYAPPTRNIPPQAQHSTHKTLSKRGLAADSTGYGTHRYETWLTIKGGEKRRGYLKLHLLIALANLAILNQNITRGTRNDSPILKTLLKPLPKSSGDLCADPAYLSRRNCNLIATKGRTPIIKPKRNTTIRKHGSQPWRDMITLWLEDQTTFLKRYHQRSKAESVYSALKRCYGNHLSSHKRTAQRRELHLRTLSYNIGIANLTTIRQENR